MSAVVLSGAVIKNDNGHTAMYYEKCEACGYVSRSTKTMSSSGNGHSVFTSGFVCPKCRKRQEVRIQH